MTMASGSTLPTRTVSPGSPKMRRKTSLTWRALVRRAPSSQEPTLERDLNDVLIRECRLVVPESQSVPQQALVLRRERAGFRWKVREPRGHCEATCAGGMARAAGNRAIFLRACGGRAYIAGLAARGRMRPICLLLLAPVLAAGQQTDASYFIPRASTTMTTTTLASAGLPSYSQLNVTDQSSVTVGVGACPAGGYSNDDALTCTLCPAGKYNPTPTATAPEACVSCEAGKYSVATGASAASTCVNCPNGTYSATIGASAPGTCLPCPANSTSYAGSRLLQACFCIPGHQGLNGQACSPCNASVWCLNGMANPCPPNSMSSPMSSSLGDCLCRASFYGDTSQGGPELTLCQVFQCIMFIYCLHTEGKRVVRAFLAHRLDPLVVGLNGLELVGLYKLILNTACPIHRCSSQPLVVADVRDNDGMLIVSMGQSLLQLF